MENPYDWPPELVEAWLERLRGVHVNRYPDPRAGALKVRLRGIMEVPRGAEIILGNGSDELIQLLVLALGGAGSTVLSPEPSFAMYALVARVSGRRFVGVALGEERFELRVDAMLEAVRREKPALVFIAYPNNPTGNLFDAEAVRAVADATEGVVVIDEAYAPFAGATFLDEVPRRGNVLVLRTLSKVGLAGLRLGVLAGPPAWIAELDKIRLPYNVNVLSQVSAEFALEHYDVFVEQTARIARERDALHAKLETMRGVEVWPSRANFLLVRTPREDAAAALRERGVLVKSFHGTSPLLERCLRVTVGKPEENEAFLRALDAVLG